MGTQSSWGIHFYKDHIIKIQLWKHDNSMAFKLEKQNLRLATIKVKPKTK